MIVDAMRDREANHPILHLVLGPGRWEAELIGSVLDPFVKKVIHNGWSTQHAFTRWTRADLIA